MADRKTDPESDVSDSEASNSEVSDSEAEEITERADAKATPPGSPGAELKKLSEGSEDLGIAGLTFKESADQPAAAAAAASAQAKEELKEEKKTHNKDLCAVENCKFLRYGRGYCCIHMITNRENEIPEPAQRVRTTLNLWYRREYFDEGKITWKFVHNGHRHEISFYHDRVSTPKRVKVDGKEINSTGFYTANNNDWWQKVTVGRGGQDFSCYLVQIVRNDTYLTDLVIDGRSFSHSRDKFINAIAAAQVSQLNDYAGITDLTDNSLHLAERKEIAANWTREEYIAKTRRGFNKNVCTWTFVIDGEKQTLTLEHGLTGGKKKIILNDRVRYEKKRGLLESNSSCAIPMKNGIKGREIRCIIKDLKKMRSRGLLHSEDDHYEKLATFDYDLEIDHIPWSSCIMCTYDLAQPGRTLPRPYDTGITDRDLRAVMQQVKNEAQAQASSGGPGF